MLPMDVLASPDTYPLPFQRAPTLGGECYTEMKVQPEFDVCILFQRAPTLGGECYTVRRLVLAQRVPAYVSTGTHPWG